jgi:hypothetical protein
MNAGFGSEWDTLYYLRNPLCLFEELFESHNSESLQLQHVVYIVMTMRDILREGGRGGIWLLYTSK